MDLLARRLRRIKEELKRGSLKRASSLLISSVASDDMFSYWSSCCKGSEKVPKILKYVRHISFDERIPTAVINFREGDLRVGVSFFMEHILGGEDLLFILIHERNHLILRKLYPDVREEVEALGHMFNFGEDAYINAVSRRFLPSTLPERFYEGEIEMLLTARHSRIDWERLCGGDMAGRRLKEAHAAIYKEARDLLAALSEPPLQGQCSGYREWMRVFGEWYRLMRHAPLKKGTPGTQEASPSGREAGANDEEGKNGGTPDDGRNDSGEDAGQQKSETKDEHDETNGHSPGEEDIESALKRVVPLVQAEDRGSPSNKHRECSQGNGGGLVTIPMPDVRPHDLEVTLILETCEIIEFRKEVFMFEGGAMGRVDGIIKGILSDRATERFHEGYSLSVPFSMTRRDVFSLSCGNIPVTWQRKVGVERPFIDLYVDVSGSMRSYYAYIPYIYDALKHLIGRIFQFSTKVVEVDYSDRHLYTTTGTDFDCVAGHMIREGVRAAIVMSDGISSISEWNMQALKAQMESLVYIKVRENAQRNWERLATQVVILIRRGGAE